MIAVLQEQFRQKTGAETEVGDDCLRRQSAFRFEQWNYRRRITGAVLDVIFNALRKALRWIQHARIIRRFSKPIVSEAALERKSSARNYAGCSHRSFVILRQNPKPEQYTQHKRKRKRQTNVRLYQQVVMQHAKHTRSVNDFVQTRPTLAAEP